MQALRCPNPHPKLPGHRCNTLQQIEMSGDWVDGMVSVKCRNCPGWIDFQFSASEGTEMQVDKEAISA